jgi:hypothetical protein
MHIIYRLEKSTIVAKVARSFVLVPCRLKHWNNNNDPLALHSSHRVDLALPKDGEVEYVKIPVMIFPQ